MALALAMLGVGTVNCDAVKIYSIDSGRVFEESREGRSILAKVEKERDSIMKIRQNETQKIAKTRNDIEEVMKAGTATEAELQEKYEKLNRVQRDAKQKVEDAEIDSKMKSEKVRIAFAQKVNGIAVEFFKKDGCHLVVDKKTPGLIYAADSTDKTDDLIKEVNNRYEKNMVAASLKKGSKNA